MSPNANTAAATAPVLEDEVVVVTDTRVELLLKEWNLPYELVQDFPLARLEIVDATQIREAGNRGPSDTVEQYITHMKHGAIFPPIVVTNTMLVDGNARVKACKVLGRKTFPAYKVKFPHLGMAKMIGAALNQLGGDRLTPEEIVVAAEAMMAADYADEAIARTLGRSVSHVRNVRKDRSVREALTRIGMADVKLPRHISRALADVQHDEPLKAAVELVSKAKPSAKDVTALVNRIEKTRSDADAIAAINEVAAQWGPVAGPPPAPQSLNKSRAKKALKQVNALLETLDSIFAEEFVIADDPAAAESWQKLLTITTNVVALYPRA